MSFDKRYTVISAPSPSGPEYRIYDRINECSISGGFDTQRWAEAVAPAQKEPPAIVDTNVKTDSAIAEEPETVDVDESHGLAARPKRPKAGTHPKAELMKEMARSGASLTEIMEVAGCSEPTARKYMKEAQDE